MENLEAYQICYNQTRQWPTFTNKMIVGTFIGIFSVLAFSLNFFIVLIIAKNFLVFQKQSSIYILLLTCCISHCCYLPSHFFVSLPGIISSSPIYSTSVMLWLSSPHTLGYYLALFSNFFIAIDRFLMLFFEHKHIMFEKCIAYFLVLCIWFWAIFLTIVFALGECHKKFNQWAMSFNYGCNGLACTKPFIFSISYDTFLLYFGQILCFIMFFLYLSCFFKLIALHSKRISGMQRNAKSHIKIIIQFFTIFLGQWASSSFMVVLPYVSIGPLPTTLISNSAGLINALANATLLLFFNRNLRKIAHGSIIQIAAPSVRVLHTRTTANKSLFHKSTY